MKVIELIELLLKEDPESMVVIQKDCNEDIGYPLNFVEGTNLGYKSINKHYGKKMFLEYSTDMAVYGHSEENVDSTAEKAVFLMSTNNG